MFGTPSASSTPAFGTPSSAPAFGSSPSFGTPSSSPAFGAPSSAMAFGAPSSAPVFGTASSTPSFITPTSSLPFGTPPSTPAFGTPSSMPAFGAPLSAPAPSPLFPQQSQQQHFTIQPASLPFGNPQITTQMAPVAPVRLSLADRDIHAIIDAYKDEPGNPKYSFRHLLLSVTDHAARVKPFGASDISWAEAMRKLEGMDSLDRDRLWPQLVQGFKDLSDRLKLQDEVIISDAERLKMTQANVKLVSLNNFVIGANIASFNKIKDQNFVPYRPAQTKFVVLLDARNLISFVTVVTGGITSCSSRVHRQPRIARQTKATFKRGGSCEATR
ncbi:nuclear pore complex protein NUP54-like isoform X3 [Zingiber officinale]|uniref:nuclear pore complex protein NUP54-like isoform X3 n=1 Tax=Zingiber officinale TaxID=94328 RepID=UPI001C4BE22E|nr:nuclear pore complex protein NUP54-like isoform X3 [Zingiber officinale]